MRQQTRQKQGTTSSETLLEEIDKAKKQIDYAYQNFQYVVDPDLIDFYIYECNAAWKRYCFLLNQAKTQ